MAEAAESAAGAGDGARVVPAAAAGQNSEFCFSEGESKDPAP